MSPQKSAASREFSRPSSTLPPPDRSGLPGKSSPLMDRFAQFSMVGVYETRKGLKFVHITSEKLEGKFTVLIFMDDRLTDLEAGEWKQFSDEMEKFREAGAQVLGVCTDSHVTIRTMLMNSDELQGIRFPIISDRDGDFSRAFGVLKLHGGRFGAARALAVLDPSQQLVHLCLHNERTTSRPADVLSLITRLQEQDTSSRAPSATSYSSSVVTAAAVPTTGSPVSSTTSSAPTNTKTMMGKNNKTSTLTPSPSKTPSTSNSKTPSTALNKTPSAINDKTPSTSNNTTSATNKTSSSTNKTPSATINNTPSATNNKSPSATNKSASATNNKTPSATINKTPSATNKVPSGTNNKSPSATNKTPSTPINKTPSSTNNKTLSATNSRTPSATNNKTPQTSKNNNTPSTTLNKTPSASKAASIPPTPAPSSSSSLKSKNDRLTAKPRVRKMAATPDSATGHRPTSTTALIPPTFYPDGEEPPKTSAPAPSAQKKH